MIAVVGDEPHSPVRGLLPDAQHADRREPVDVEPTRLHVRAAVVRVARRLVRSRVVGQVSGDHAREVGLGHDGELVGHVQRGRQPQPVEGEVVLAERVGTRRRMREEGGRGRVQRKTPQMLVTQLFLTVDLERDGPGPGRERRRAAAVEDETGRSVGTASSASAPGAAVSAAAGTPAPSPKKGKDASGKGVARNQGERCY